MTSIEVRNILVKGLSDHLGIPVLLADQVAPEAPVPFAIYTMTAPYITTSEFGDHSYMEQNGDLLNVRKEQSYASFSFTFCSENRFDGPRNIYGDDEALALAESAIAWFRHIGREVLSRNGVVLVDIANAGNRTVLVIDEAARRYGFDVRIRYTRVDTRNDGSVKQLNYHPKE